MKKRSFGFLAVMFVALCSTACETGRTLWGRCDPAVSMWGVAGEGPGAYISYCNPASSEWEPVMTALEYVKLRQGEKIGIAPVPVKPAPTTTTQTPVTEPPKPACPPAPTGNWSGSWWSDQGVGGSLSVGLQRTGNSLSGTLSISGSDLITGGQISGTVTCNKVRFGKVDKSIEFEGAIDADGAMVTGTYSASILKGGQRWPDSGTFTIRLR